jgi:autotransporter-associated beta strand protein
MRWPCPVTVSRALILNGGGSLGSLGSMGIVFGLLTYAGPITGTGPLQIGNGDSINGAPGPVEITGTSNTYTGGTNVVSATLRISSDNVLPPGTLTLNAGTVQVGASLTMNRNLVFGGSTDKIDTNGFDVAIAGVVSGAKLNKVGAGTLTLTTANTYSGGTTISAGTLSVTSDAGLGSGPVIFLPTTALNFAGTTVTARTFNLNGGTLSVSPGVVATINGGPVYGGTVDGAGTFTTDPINGARFNNITTAPAVTITSNSPADQFVHVTNSGTLTVAPGATGAGSNINLNGFTNEGLGPVTVGLGSQINVANFQSYGTVSLIPGPSAAQPTRLTNLGTSPLGFNGGSRTFIGTPQTVGQNLALVDLHGQNAVVAGGLFVNNGFVGDSTGRGGDDRRRLRLAGERSGHLPERGHHPKRRPVPGGQLAGKGGVRQPHRWPGRCAEP